MLLRKIESSLSESERAKWRVVRIDTYETIPGLILSADCDSGVCNMRQRGPDQVEQDGTRKATFSDKSYSLGAGSITLIS